MSARAGNKNGAKPSASEAAIPAPEPPAAPFAAIAPQAVDGEMWPVHAAAWFQAEQPPSPPAWSTLTIERRHRIPSPDFLSPEVAPFSRPAAPKPPYHEFTPAAQPQLPESGLTPAGWDPRALSPKEGRT